MLKQIINIFEKHEKKFLHGGKYEKLFPLFEAFQSFLYLPKTVTKSKVHVRDSVDTKRYMGIVVGALMPCLAFGTYNVGYQTRLSGQLSLDFMSVIIDGLWVVLPLIIVSYGVGLGLEFLFCIIRGHEVNEGFLVTGMLYVLILPPTIPLWQAAVGIAFAVIVGKEVFGGSGRNFLNPALTASP